MLCSCYWSEFSLTVRTLNSIIFWLRDFSRKLSYFLLCICSTLLLESIHFSTEFDYLLDLVMLVSPVVSLYWTCLFVPHCIFRNDILLALWSHFTFWLMLKHFPWDVLSTISATIYFWTKIFCQWKLFSKRNDRIFVFILFIFLWPSWW